MATPQVPTSFRPRSVERFRYGPISVDAAGGRVALHYTLEGPSLEVPFVEQLGFSRPLPTGGPARQACDRLLQLLHLLAGVSYYKAALPPRILIPAPLAPTDEEVAFLERTFRAGLAELLYRNGLPLDLPLAIDVERPAPPAPPLAADALGGSGALVPVGGGKDSAVSLEVTRRVDPALVTFSVNRFAAITATAAAAERPLVSTARTIDPRIVALNDAGAINGHIPITAITTVVALVEALLHGRRDVVMSNERSASAPTRWVDGSPVNHQYAKSLEFERDLAAVVEAIAGDGLRAFSLLRPLGELAILRLFSHHGRYHEVFLSCNRAFAVDPERRGRTWCGDCDKCRFVALGLAPFLERSRLVAIMGRDVLDDPAQLEGFRRLVGLGDGRPFECVGTELECQVAVDLAAQRGDYADAAAVAELAPWASPTPVQILDVFAPHREHLVPDEYLEALRAAVDLCA